MMALVGCSKQTATSSPTQNVEQIKTDTGNEQVQDNTKKESAQENISEVAVPEKNENDSSEKSNEKKEEEKLNKEASPNSQEIIGSNPPITSSQKAESKSSKSSQQVKQPVELAKSVASIDDSGADYFILFDYNQNNYLVRAYMNQQGPGLYSGLTEDYLVNKTSGQASKTIANQIDFNKHILVYAKQSGRVIE